MKACIISLGCPKNLTDSEVLMGKLACAGYSFTDKIKDADLVVINTCAFLKSARDESISTIKKISKQRKKGAKIYIAGCLPEYYKNQVKEPSRRSVGTGSVEKLSDGIIDSIDLFDSHSPRIKATNPWTAYVKISEGCNNHCSYCLIPKIRGKLKNRPIKDILSEVKALAKRGVKEIIYVAQDTTAYPYFPALLHKTTNIKGLRWIRVMYAHPAHITDKLINTIASHGKICKYIDLPVQHICDKILKSMKRGVTASQIINIIDKLRRKKIAIRTSLIVGYPGETEEDFNNLVDFVRKVKFERLGVFKYSREEGTPAYNMRGQVPEKVKNYRFHKLMALQKKISGELNKKLIGKVLDVLIEKIGSEIASGRTYMDAPEIDGSVKLNFNSRLARGKFVKATVTRANAYDLAACIT